jgi:integral membrane protein
MMNPIKTLKIVGYLEGLSFLILLGIAMPLKYFMGIPIAVMIAGSLHGLLFVLYILSILYVWNVKRWPFMRTFLAMLSSVIPFGPFIFDRKFLKD